MQGKIVQNQDMRLPALRGALLNGKIALEDLVDEIYEKIEFYKDHHAWIYVSPKELILAKAKALESLENKNDLPLFGIPYAVKDNIDVAGIPTTAACEAFSYIPAKSADVVKRIEAAGGLMIGKTNMDQFATGLVGTRSPYGAVKNSFNPTYIAGGSSAGSAVAVALGMASFSLGTDTAGSGRVPAGFNNLFGLKPTKKVLSTDGVVPACKSLDCVSIFALSAEDASTVFDITTEVPATDSTSGHGIATSFTFAVPWKHQLNFSGNSEYEKLYLKGVDKLKKAGGVQVDFDFAPFLETAALLYEGPWVAERLAAIKDFFEAHSNSMWPETSTIIGGAKKFSAVDTFLSLYKLDELKEKTAPLWKYTDVMVVPTTPTIYTIEQIKAEPFSLNKNLGYYTNFVNLLNLCAFAVPNGFQMDGLPMGITMIAPAHQEQKLLQLGKLFTR